jgi:hypothetical protein
VVLLLPIIKRGPPKESPYLLCYLAIRLRCCLQLTLRRRVLVDGHGLYANVELLPDSSNVLDHKEDRTSSLFHLPRTKGPELEEPNCHTGDKTQRGNCIY